MVLVLRSGIPEEVDWALDRLLWLCSNEKFLLSAIPGLTDALFSWPESNERCWIIFIRWRTLVLLDLKRRRGPGPEDALHVLPILHWRCHGEYVVIVRLPASTL